MSKYFHDLCQAYGCNEYFTITIYNCKLVLNFANITTLHDNTDITTVASHYSADVSKYLIQHARYIRTNLLSSLYQVSDREKEKSLCNDCIIQ